MSALDPKLGYLTITRNADGSHTCVTKTGKHLTVPAGVIPPAASFVEQK